MGIAKIWTDDRLDTCRARLKAGKHATIPDLMAWVGLEWLTGKTPDERTFKRAFQRKFGDGAGSVIPRGAASGAKAPEEKIEIDLAASKGTITTRSLNIKTVAEALAVAEVDASTWDVDRHVINSWEVTGRDKDGEFQTFTNWQVKVWLKRKGAEVQSLELLLEQIKKAAPKAAKLRAPRKRKADRILELSIVDVHNGLRCSPPNSDDHWNMEISRRVLLDTSAGLLDKARAFGPFRQIVVPIGHDWMHIDNMAGTTTAGTNQPEADQWHDIWLASERLAIEWVLALRLIAPVRVVVVPGNHDYASGFAMGRLLNAYFHNDHRVDVDASPDPFKWIHFGVNLVGMTHKSEAPIRLAALMASQRPRAWAATTFREWHLGDQHRTGNGNPTMMEEQGVSVDFLPSIVPGNEWHKRKCLNNQRRAGTAHVWDRSEGLICKLTQRAQLQGVK